MALEDLQESVIISDPIVYFATGRFVLIPQQIIVLTRGRCVLNYKEAPIHDATMPIDSRTTEFRPRRNALNGCRLETLHARLHGADQQ